MRSCPHGTSKVVLVFETEVVDAKIADGFFCDIMQSKAATSLPMSLDLNKLPSPPLLTIFKLKQYIEAEYSIFVFHIQLIIQLKAKQGRGCPFDQINHDDVTIANHKKYQ